MKSQQGSPFLKKGGGMGGKSFSLNSPPKSPPGSPPKN